MQPCIPSIKTINNKIKHDGKINKCFNSNSNEERSLKVLDKPSKLSSVDDQEEETLKISI